MIKKNNIRFIDLNLPSGNLWGDRNFGNNKYYAWGELKGYSKSQFGKEKIFDDEHYKYYDNIYSNLTKYYEFDILINLLPEDDIVTSTLGENYKTPRKKDFEELLEYTDKIYTENFITFKSKINGNQIIFPLLGYAYGSSVYGAGKYCLFWSSSLLEDDPSYAWVLDVTVNGKKRKEGASIDCDNRYIGCVIRSIYDKEK